MSCVQEGAGRRRKNKVMATSTIRHIEAEFAHLSPEEQLHLLARLVQEFRVGGWGQRGFRGNHADLLEANPELRGKLERMSPSLDTKAVAADLLNEMY